MRVRTAGEVYVGASALTCCTVRADMSVGWTTTCAQGHMTQRA